MLHDIYMFFKTVSFSKCDFSFEYDKIYYDGWNHGLWLGFLFVHWITSPKKKDFI
jgi:hypothetical protein